MKGFGFIQRDDGQPDAFVHISAVERAGMPTLNEGDRLEFELEVDRRGKYAAVNLAAEATRSRLSEGAEGPAERSAGPFHWSGRHRQERVDPVRLGRRLVGADAADPREAHREARICGAAVWIESNATSSTRLFSTSRTGPKRWTVWPRTQRSSHFSSSSVKPK